MSVPACRLGVRSGPVYGMGESRDLRRELWEESSAAFQHLGDASPYISTAEAFVRHNAHDCIYPDHEKDFRVLQLFARRFMQGRLLVVLRLSHQGIVEIDTVRGTGALEAYGAVVIHRGHMRTARCSVDQAKQLFEIATQGERVVRELEVEGWGSFLEAQDASGEIIPSKPHPCYRCRKAGVEEDDAGDPARPSVDTGLCGVTAQPAPQRFSLFVPLREMDSEVVRTLGAADSVSVRPLPDVQSGHQAWLTWAISQPGPTLASDCWILRLKNATLSRRILKRLFGHIAPSGSSSDGLAGASVTWPSLAAYPSGLSRHLSNLVVCLGEPLVRAGTFCFLGRFRP